MISEESAIRIKNVGAFLLVLAINGCTPLFSSPTATPPLQVPAWELILDDQAFPEGWSVFPCGPPESACQRQYREAISYRDFGRVGIAGHVAQEVSRLESISAARSNFQIAREVDFRKSKTRSPSTEFLPPAEISYRSPIADEYYLGCGVDVVPACRAILRYGNYFVYFYFSVDDGNGEGLKTEEIEPILRAMDERAALVLGIPLPSNPS